jgi:hypothetical protein
MREIGTLPETKYLTTGASMVIRYSLAERLDPHFLLKPQRIEEGLLYGR